MADRGIAQTGQGRSGQSRRRRWTQSSARLPMPGKRRSCRTKPRRSAPSIATSRRPRWPPRSSSVRRRTSCCRPTARSSATGRSGERLAQNGYGGRHTDDPKLAVGGNCYACHQLSKTEVSFGTMGPPLDEYGKIRKYAEATPRRPTSRSTTRRRCSPAPTCRGSDTTSTSTEQQIKDIVALLFDPESPVNK